MSKISYYYRLPDIIDDVMRKSVVNEDPSQRRNPCLEGRIVGREKYSLTSTKLYDTFPVEVTGRPKDRAFELGHLAGGGQAD